MSYDYGSPFQTEKKKEIEENLGMNNKNVYVLKGLVCKIWWHLAVRLQIATN